MEFEKDSRDSLWNPNDLLPKKQTDTSKGRDLSKIRVAFLTKLLENERPIITTNMLPFLLQEGVAEILANIVTCIDANLLPTTEALNNHSLKVVELFMQPSPPFQQFLDKRAGDMLVALFRVFDSTDGCRCNMLLWLQVVQKLFELQPKRSVEAVAEHNLLALALPHLIHPPVAQLVVWLCSMHASSRDASRLMSRFTRRVAHCLVGGSNDPGLGLGLGVDAGVVQEGCYALLLRLIDEYQTALQQPAPGGMPPLPPPLEPIRSPEFIEGLLRGAQGESGVNHSDTGMGVGVGVGMSARTRARQRCLDVLARLMALGPPFTQAVASRTDLLDPAAMHLESSSLYMKYSLAYVISHLVADQDARIAVFDGLSQQTWHALSSWFLKHPHSNLYHQQFCNIVCALVDSGHETALRKLFVKCKWLTNIIRHYENRSTPSSSRGYILMICQHIRAVSGQQPQSSFLKHFLQSHDIWRKFTPVLDEEVQRQATAHALPSVPKKEGFASGDVDLMLNSLQL